MKQIGPYAVSVGALLLMMMWCAAAPPTSAQTPTAVSAIAKSPNPELIGSLTKGLSVTPEQATGGAGALFGLAKSRLSTEDFSKVANAAPGMDGLLNGVPKPKGNSPLDFVLNTSAMAETTKVEGVIVGRSGNVMIVEFLQGAELAFLLNDNTQVSQTGGLFKARRTDKSMAALIPGLKVKVEGTYNESRQLVATKVIFKGDDLEQAQIAEAANRQSRKQLEEQRAELERQAAALKEQNEQLQLQQAQLAEHKAQIAAAVSRFGEMDDYYIFDELTVYFANGKAQVDPKYEALLLELAMKAKSIDGYVIEVTGYSSSAGSTTVNQKLSEDRANGVTNILLQRGHVPLTRILAPGAMGEAHQVATDKGAEGQAENRRVVVRVLQNKAIAGV